MEEMNPIVYLKMVDTEKITLVTVDGEKFELTKAQSAMSGLITSMLDNLDDDEDELPILNDINSKTLRKVIEYLDYHKDVPTPDIPKPLETTIEEAVPEWDANYINLSQEELFELVMAANFLDINPLINLVWWGGLILILGTLIATLPKEVMNKQTRRRLRQS